MFFMACHLLIIDIDFFMLLVYKSRSINCRQVFYRPEPRIECPMETGLNMIASALFKEFLLPLHPFAFYSCKIKLILKPALEIEKPGVPH